MTTKAMALIVALIVSVPLQILADAALVEMVPIPPGSFTMGNPAQEWASPARTVSISKNFSIGRFEVTNRQFVQVVNYLIDRGEMRIDKAALWNNSTRQYRLLFQDKKPYYHQLGLTSRNGRLAVVPGREDHPVVGVTWRGVLQFCNGLSATEGLEPAYTSIPATSEVIWNRQANGYRLPTEAEWEYAARGGVSDRAFPWGNLTTPSVANYQDSDQPYSPGPPLKYMWGSWSKGGPTTPVGFFDGKAHRGYQTKSNASLFGIFDMGGNVSEWCWDTFQLNYNNLPDSDPSGPYFSTAKVVRGGAYDRPAEYLTVSHRENLGEWGTSAEVGFRLARNTE